MIKPKVSRGNVKKVYKVKAPPVFVGREIKRKPKQIVASPTKTDTQVDKLVEQLLAPEAKARGLTLEGLSVSYFLRTAQLLLADTMTQMGRFFGYRKGYLDLCRLYITQPLNDVFHEFANSLTHLDSQFIEAAIGELTPKEYMYIPFL